MSEQYDSSYLAFIVEYNFTYADYMQNPDIPKSNIRYYPLELNADDILSNPTARCIPAHYDCIEIWGTTTTQLYNDCEVVHANGQSCNPQIVETEILIGSECWWIASSGCDGGSAPGGTGQSGSNSSGTVGSSPGDGTSPLVTTPTLPNWQIVAGCLGINFVTTDSEEQAILNFLQGPPRANNSADDDLANYIHNNGCNQQFTQDALETIMDGGSVDLDDGIILGASFLSNQKLLCVYNALRANSYTNNNNPETVFNNIISDYFEGAKNANIKFEVGTTPNGEDAVTLPYIGTPTDPGSVSNYKIIINSNILSNLSSLEMALLLIHESIHAELLERCFRLGLINTITMVGGVPQGISLTSNPGVVYNIGSDLVFSSLALGYYNYGGGNSQWNHDLFTTTNYLSDMTQNLIDIHPALNDINNDFLTSVNNDPNIVGGPYTLSDIMGYASWIGLEGTQEYINNIQNNPIELAKKNYIEGVIRSLYNQNCN